MKFLKALGLAAAVLFAAPAAAQTEADFIAAFAGDWLTFEPSLSSSGQCQLELDQARNEIGYTVSTTSCAGPLVDLGGWGIVNNQLALLDSEGAIRVRLGGNQTRMTGDTADGRAVIFERAGTPGRSITAAGISSGTCIYLGYTASCAEVAALEAPAFDDDDLPQARILVDLNARAEARPDANVVATIPQNTCVALEQCLEASDGRWCRAQVADTGAWIRQQVVRRGQWPALTYVNGCAR
jgi:hypothetical protein